MIRDSLLALVCCLPIFVVAAGTGNPYEGATVTLDPAYVDKVRSAVANIYDPLLAAQAALVEQYPTFAWMDKAASVPRFGDLLALASKSEGIPLVQGVVYDLPDRDCSAKASAGEFSIADGGAENYKAYIDSIVEQIEKFPNVRVVLVVEPDSLANLVTNLDVPKCANAESTYKELVSHAISQLQQDNVWLYIDAGHCGWLGWPDNLEPAADLFSEVLQGAGENAMVRGLATDVSNYNTLRGEQVSVLEDNPNYNEERYANAIAPLLEERGFPSQFIIDQGRAGVAEIKTAGDDWCNIAGAGIGLRPSTDTGNTLIDSIVWVKPPGDSDGTSNTSSVRFDEHCGRNNSVQPAPEAGGWFQAYFEQLVKNANPPLA